MNRLVILVILVAVAIAMFAASAEGIIALMDYYFFLKLQISYSYRKSDVIFREKFQHADWLRTRQLITNGAEK